MAARLLVSWMDFAFWKIKLDQAFHPTERLRDSEILLHAKIKHNYADVKDNRSSHVSNQALHPHGVPVPRWLRPNRECHVARIVSTAVPGLRILLRATTAAKAQGCTNEAQVLSALHSPEAAGPRLANLWRWREPRRDRRPRLAGHWPAKFGCILPKDGARVNSQGLRD